MQYQWPGAVKSVFLLRELAKRWDVVSAVPMALSNDFADLPAVATQGPAITVNAIKSSVQSPNAVYLLENSDFNLNELDMGIALGALT